MFRISSSFLRRLALLGLCAAACVSAMVPGTANAYWYHGYNGWHAHAWHHYGWHGYGWRPPVIIGAPLVVPPPVVLVRPPVAVYTPFVR